jgi:hypothetical protein
MIYKYNLACGFRHLGKLVRRPFRLFPTNFIFERPVKEVVKLKFNI